jgi:AbrB family looped-hinge helix DNA binding protein
MTTLTVRANGEIVIPRRVVEERGLKPGSEVVLGDIGGDLVLHATSEERDPNQAWFWTPEWQEMIREAEEDVKAGRVSKWYSDVDEMIADIRRGAQ